MHETSLVDSLFDQVDDLMIAHPATRLALVEVGIGALAGVEPQLFISAFEGLRVDRGHAQAELQVRWLPAQWQCPLGHPSASPVTTTGLSCPQCHAPLQLQSGDEILLLHLELTPNEEVLDV